MVGLVVGKVKEKRFASKRNVNALVFGGLCLIRVKFGIFLSFPKARIKISSKKCAPSYQECWGAVGGQSQTEAVCHKVFLAILGSALARYSRESINKTCDTRELYQKSVSG